MKALVEMGVVGNNRWASMRHMRRPRAPFDGADRVRCSFRSEILRRPSATRRHGGATTRRGSTERPPAPIVLRSPRGYWWYAFLIGLPVLAACSVAVTVLFQENLRLLPWLNQLVTSISLEVGRSAGQEEAERKESPRIIPHLSSRDARAAINEPAELGIVLNNGTGSEILVLSGFWEGTRFSAGAALGATRWSLPGTALDKAFISAPENFSGTMRVVATLYSASHEVLETKAIRFEWSVPEEVERTAATDPATGAGTPSETGAEDAAQGRFSDAFGSAKRENDAPATSEHAQPSTHGPSPLWFTMVVDWLSRISSISLPATDRPFERTINFRPLPASSPAGLAESGLRLLQEGKIRAARPLLRRATDAGNADAAIALARTFDPLFLQMGNPDRVTANPAEAARWYRRGIRLGRKDVSADLERVAGMIRITSPPPDRDGSIPDPTPDPTE